MAREVYMKKLSLMALMVSIALMLQGCIVAAVGVGAGVAKVASDPRTAGTQVDDTTLDSKISMKFKNEADYFKGSRIVASSYDGDVLLIGQAKSQAVIDRAVNITKSVEDVNKLYNQIQIGNIISASTMANDAWITTKVKAALVNDKNTKARDIKVITENGEVFLFGIVSREEGQIAAQITSKVSGVRLVKMLFRYLN